MIGLHMLDVLLQDTRTIIKPDYSHVTTQQETYRDTKSTNVANQPVDAYSEIILSIQLCVMSMNRLIPIKFYNEKNL